MIEKHQIRQGETIRFLHSVRNGNELVLQGKVKELLEDGSFILEVVNHESAYNRRSMNGTRCHRNAVAIR